MAAITGGGRYGDCRHGDQPAYSGMGGWTVEVDAGRALPGIRCCWKRQESLIADEAVGVEWTGIDGSSFSRRAIQSRREMEA